MMEVLEKQDQFAALEACAAPTPSEPSWLVQRRREAAAKMRALGWPTKRNEDWRFTSTRALAQMPFVPAPAALKPDLQRFVLQDDSWVLAFVNGRFSPELSRCADQPAGLTLSTLAQALVGPYSDEVEAHLGQLDKSDQDLFPALNLALGGEGVLIRLEADLKLTTPIEIIHYQEDEGQPFLACPRHLILAGPRSSCSIVTSYVGPGACLISSVSELFAGPQATVHHYLRENSSESASHVHRLAAKLDQQADVQSHSLLTGGVLVRNDLVFRLCGEGATVSTRGLSIGHGAQHQETTVTMDHEKAHCTSNQFFKGIFDDKAHGVSTSRVVVRPGAQKTDSRQTVRNLLLSDGARVDSQPQLEIYADDVKCAHGAATGQLDEEALFYMNARGIPPEDARVLLLFAFANDVLGQMPLESLRAEAESFLMARFAKGLLGGRA